MTSFYWFAFHFVLGLWLIAAPYALGFTDTLLPYANSVAVGAVVVLSSGLAMYLNREQATRQARHEAKKAA
ncbi:MAG TPA: SPW repeat protein [candidate division Zixibacteria bacterium]|nr:SPW repeat protein [candidate division Zixibacteria bacterium]